MPKRSSLPNLPGGENQYLGTTNKFLRYVQDDAPKRSEATDWFAKQFLLRRCLKNIESFVRFFEIIEMIRESEDRLEVTVDGITFLKENDLELVYRKLAANYLVIEEVLQVMADGKRPLVADEILYEINKRLGVCWRTKRQLAIRLNWLVALRKISRGRNGYRLFDVNTDSVASSEPQVSLHSRIQEMLVEIGRLLDFDVSKEHVIDGKLQERLDVLWRSKEAEGQTVAFEISLKGDLSHALLRLRTALRKLGSIPVLVISEDDRTKAEAEVSRFSDLKANLKTLTTTDVEKARKSPEDFLRILKKIIARFVPELRETSKRHEFDAKSAEETRKENTVRKILASSRGLSVAPYFVP